MALFIESDTGFSLSTVLVFTQVPAARAHYFYIDFPSFFCLLCNLVRTLEVICLHLAQSSLHHVTLKDSHYSNETVSADA